MPTYVIRAYVDVQRQMLNRRAGKKLKQPQDYLLITRPLYCATSCRSQSQNQSQNATLHHERFLPYTRKSLK